MFRAWNNITREYNYFVEVTTYKDGSVGVTAGAYNNAPIGNTDNFVLEMWTGLKDKNGDKIYFGDKVLKYADDETEDYHVLIVEQILGHTEIGCFSYYEDSEDFTIVGNIHED